MQLGAVALCPSCSAARSTLGKGQNPVPLRRHVNASLIAHIGKEANLLEQRQSGELTPADEDLRHDL